MIIGIGTDLASIARIRDTLEGHGARFLDRVFTSAEQDRVEGASKGNIDLRAAGYAKRWAAKEAAAKALGLGIRDDIFLKDISVVNDHAGKPDLVVTGGARDRLMTLTPQGMTAALHVSLSDDRQMASAFVIISAIPQPQRDIK